MKDSFSFRIYDHLSCPVHINSDTEFVYVESGSLKLEYEQTDIVLEPGSMAHIMPYHLHGFNAEQGAQIWVIMFPYSIADEFLKNYGSCDFSSIVFKPSSELITYLKTVYTNPYHDPFMQTGLYNCLVSEYTSSVSFFKRQNTRVSTVQNIMKYLLRSVYSADDVSVEMIAKEVGETPQNVRNILKKYIGISLSEFITNLRLQRALTLLHDTDLSITEIAYQSGFSSIRTFNRNFKRVYKSSPKENRTKFF